MGIVYEVFDRERGENVALKTLSRVDPAGIYDLKKEFRSLADVRHPNVVSLFDIVHAGGQWFFTMELVYGTPFSDYVASDAAHHARDDRAMLSTTQTRADPRTGTLPFDETRLRSALSQLVLGVSAIHSAGKLHRDLKPSNVLITSEGRLVVLDFGLVQDDSRHSDTAETSLDDNLVVGTPAYMAPEQAAGKRATPASDWYAVGTMLYRALSGRLPFSGSVTEVLLKKQTDDPPPLPTLVRGLPSDLESLTMALLARRPDARADESDIRRRLSLQRAPVRPSQRPEGGLLIGRDAELSWLELALAESRRGSPQVLFVEGASGMGKTALVQHFLRGVRQNGSAVVLSGRCYPREALPYKAFDAIVDALSRYLSRLPEAAAAELLPRNRRALTSLFPVLDRVPIIDAWDSLARLPASPAQRRERAFAALKELLGRISDQGPLVLHIDNLEWGDRDSAELLSRICAAPDPPAMLVIGTHQSDGGTPGAFWSALGPPAPTLGEASRQHHTIGPLSHDDALELCRRALGGDDEVAVRVADETAGDPLLVALLCEHLREHPPAQGETGPRAHLEALVELELARLGPDARRMLDYVVIAGAPVLLETAAAAAAVSPDLMRAAQSELRGSNLVQVVYHRGREAVSVRHERIAQTLLAALAPAEVRAHHRRWAELLASRDEANAETLAEHFEKAGSSDEARRYTATAALLARRALAFDRAAELYERALAATTDSLTQSQLFEQLADVRLHLGQPGAAATALIAAAERSSADRAADLRRRAAALRLTDEQIDALFGESSSAGLFDGIAREAVQAFLAKGQIIEAARGACVSPRTDGPASVLVVLSGAVSVEQQGGRVSIGAGEILGTLSFLQNAPRLADVHAAEDGTRVLAITRTALDELSQVQPQLALQLTVNLARILCGKLVNVHARAFGL